MLIRSNPFVTSQLQQCLQQWEHFSSELKPDHSVGLIYHGDADGMIAAAYVQECVSGLVAECRSYWVSTDEYDFADLSVWVERFCPSHLIFLDIAIENEPELLKRIVGKRPTFIFDHHILRRSLNVEGVILANPTPKPLETGEVPMPSFAFALALGNKHNLWFPDWLLTFLCFAEGVESFFEPFLRDKCSSIIPISPSETLRAWYRRSPLSRLGSLLRAAFSEPAKTDVVIRMFSHAIIEQHPTCAQLLQMMEARFGAEAQRIAQAINELVDRHEAQIIRSPNRLIVIQVDDVHSVAGPVASILRGKTPNKIILTMVRRRNLQICELRTGLYSKTNLVDILKAVSTKVPLVNFGGHASAAGALLHTEYVDLFLSTLHDACGINER